MSKKGVRVTIFGKQRRQIDVELMTQAVIALGPELAERKPGRRKTRKSGASATAAVGTGSRWRRCLASCSAAR
jgi:hypothetical protein